MERGDEKRPADMSHYYGDTVRRLFLIGGALVLITVLFDKRFLALYLYVGVIVVLVLTLLAGLTSPTNRQVLIGDTILSGLLYLLFEYAAISAYLAAERTFDVVFILHQANSFIFLAALYLGSKTLRAKVLNL